ncbi:MAG: protease HtpX [Oligoflexia bacterium]|nr:MAG: protease HtpX [Oligoflexia bacterium]
MKWFKRISLFVLTNILVMVTISIAFNIVVNVFGLRQLDSYFGYMLVFCCFWGMGGAFISLLISKFMAKMAMGVQIIEPNTQDPRLRDLVNMTYDLARKAGLQKMPEVGIYEAPEINAFATGPSRSNSLVAVSTGLLQAMDRNEVEGVIGHEVAHIANGDMVTMTLIQGVVNSFVMFLARIIAHVVSSQVEEKSRNAVHFAVVIVLDILFTILGSILVNYFSRQREFRADKGGAVYAGRDKMIAGLRRLQSQFDMIDGDNGGMATMKISNKSTGLMALFSSHPPLEERIQRLEQLTYDKA